FLLNLEIGYLLPPAGLNLFIAALRFKRPITELYRAVLPFILIMVAALALVTYVPTLTVVPPAPERRAAAVDIAPDPLAAPPPPPPAPPRPPAPRPPRPPRPRRPRPPRPTRRRRPRPPRRLDRPPAAGHHPPVMIVPLLRAMRPRQWAKNFFFVGAPML